MTAFVSCKNPHRMVRIFLTESQNMPPEKVRIDRCQKNRYKVSFFYKGEAAPIAVIRI